MPGSFLDTNVLIYLATSEPQKAERAAELLGQGATISIQVLNELANVLRRKASFSWGETDEFLSTVRSLVALEPLTLETHELGLSIAERYGLSLYDAMIVAAAILADCDLIWSEDMQDGMEIDKRVRICNPFRR